MNPFGLMCSSAALIGMNRSLLPVSGSLYKPMVPPWYHHGTTIPPPLALYLSLWKALPE